MTGWYPCCDAEWPPGNCLFCNPGTTPENVQVTIPPLGNGTCTNCAAIGGTYILPPVSTCTYERDVIVNLGACGDTIFRITASISQQGGGYQYRSVRVMNLDTGEYTLWYYLGPYGYPFDCSGTYIMTYAIGYSGECIHTASGTTVEWVSLY